MRDLSKNASLELPQDDRDPDQRVAYRRELADADVYQELHGDDEELAFILSGGVSSELRPETMRCLSVL